MARPDTQLQHTAPAAEGFPGYIAALDAADLSSRPVGLLDLDRMGANAASLRARASGKPIRVASKSLRLRGALDHVLGLAGFSGVLAFTLPEALWLVEHGATDVVLGYPCADPAALRALAGNEAARAAITLMVDDVAQLDLLGAAAPGHAPLRIALELDASYQPLPGVRIGAARSPVHTPEQATRLAVAVLRRPSLRLVGMMAYEGQIAGVGNAARTPRGAMVRAMQKASAGELAQRRAAAVAAVRTVADLEFVNGGGTGSLEGTAAEPAVTEVAAGSGLFGPGLFDAYRHFHPSPALFFGMHVVRRPGPDTVTVLGGGWVASGPPAPDRLPKIAWPEGLRYHGTEAAGEVQTPLSGPAAAGLELGDTVFFRHAKSGEVCERLNEVAVYSRGRIIDVWATYRGEGKAFL